MLARTEREFSDESVGPRVNRVLTDRPGFRTYVGRVAEDDLT